MSFGTSVGVGVGGLVGPGVAVGCAVVVWFVVATCVLDESDVLGFIALPIAPNKRINPNSPVIPHFTFRHGSNQCDN
jgi:hypothetical protein